MHFKNKVGIGPLGTTAPYNDILDNRPFSVSSYNVKEGTAKLKRKVKPMANYGPTKTTLWSDQKVGGLLHKEKPRTNALPPST